jgi:hypothetical protein
MLPVPTGEGIATCKSCIWTWSSGSCWCIIHPPFWCMPYLFSLRDTNILRYCTRIKLCIEGKLPLYISFFFLFFSSTFFFVCRPSTLQYMHLLLQVQCDWCGHGPCFLYLPSFQLDRWHIYNILCLFFICDWFKGVVGRRRTCSPASKAKVAHKTQQRSLVHGGMNE